MTDKEFADWLGRVPRELSEEEVAQREHQHDIERGYWVGNEIVHHAFGEGAH